MTANYRLKRIFWFLWGWRAEIADNTASGVSLTRSGARWAARTRIRGERGLVR